VLGDALTPVYPATEGVQQGRLRNLTGQALKLMQLAPPEELLPKTVCR
jgi:ATP-dependent DNA helicase RecG